MDDDGALVPAGQPGEVVIRGANVTRGYENSPEANAAAFVNGWCRTGDRGVIDADGYLSLMGRLKEIINRGGEKIAPREIDEVLLSHPDVREAAAFPVIHPTLGEDIAAAVVPRDGRDVSETTLREFAQEHLAPFKVPARILVLDRIPKGPTGKIQRRALSTHLAEALAVAYEPPSGSLEQLIVTTFEHVLAIDRVGRHDNFFVLGGDSIRAAQVEARLIEALGIAMQPTTVFRHPTPAALATHLTGVPEGEEVASIAAELLDLPHDEAVRLVNPGVREP
jgi:hypothetical protein